MCTCIYISKCIYYLYVKFIYINIYNIHMYLYIYEKLNCLLREWTNSQSSNSAEECLSHTCQDYARYSLIFVDLIGKNTTQILIYIVFMLHERDIFKMFSIYLCLCPFKKIFLLVFIY